MKRCYICESPGVSDVLDENGWDNRYFCDLCGYVALDPREVSKLDWKRDAIPLEKLNILCIVLRNEFENSGRKVPNVNNSIDDLIKKIDRYTPLDAIGKMDTALLALHSMEETAGSAIQLTPHTDYPLFHCRSEYEMLDVLKLLEGEGYLFSDTPGSNPRITARGYQNIKEIRQPKSKSNQCFVAMWYSVEMDDVYDRAVRPAIEYKEDGADESRYKAVRLDNEEHINNINDEIIAQIRRSRFMVCDLTGYRGGVYFEAGFAYGLGLDVIYTCRKDWSEDQILKNKPAGDDVPVLYDDLGQEVHVRKEGIHFDLVHMNRIEWAPDDLDDFRKRLENRIKAVIV